MGTSIQNRPESRGIPSSPLRGLVLLFSWVHCEIPFPSDLIFDLIDQLDCLAVASDVIQDVSVIVSFILVRGGIFVVLFRNLFVRFGDIELALVVPIIRILVGHILFTLNFDGHDILMVTNPSLPVEVLVDLNSRNRLFQIRLELLLTIRFDDRSLEADVLELLIKELHQLHTPFPIITDQVIAYVLV